MNMDTPTSPALQVFTGEMHCIRPSALVVYFLRRADRSALHAVPWAPFTDVRHTSEDHISFYS